jgi:Ca2+-binding EF-hand superfamily protein
MRLLRVARLTVHIRSLYLLVSGLQHAAPVIISTFVLLVVVTYAFAVLGMQLIPSQDTSRDAAANEVAFENFGSLSLATMTLLQALTLDSVSGIYRPLVEEGSKPVLVLSYFIAYILLVSITLMNLVTAVMVEDAMAQAEKDKAYRARLLQNDRDRLRPELEQMFSNLDKDEDGTIDLNELFNAPPQLMMRLQALMQVDHLSDIFYLLDNDGNGTIGVDELVDGVIQAASANDRALRFQVARLVRQVSMIKACVCNRDLTSTLNLKWPSISSSMTCADASVRGTSKTQRARAVSVF